MKITIEEILSKVPPLSIAILSPIEGEDEIAKIDSQQLDKQLVIIRKNKEKIILPLHMKVEYGSDCFDIQHNNQRFYVFIHKPLTLADLLN